MAKPIKASYDAGGYDQDAQIVNNGASADQPCRSQHPHQRISAAITIRAGIWHMASTIGTQPVAASPARIANSGGHWSQACASWLTNCENGNGENRGAAHRQDHEPAHAGGSKLDIQLVEADRLTAPGGVWDTPDYVVGIH